MGKAPQVDSVSLNQAWHQVRRSVKQPVSGSAIPDSRAVSFESHGETGVPV